ncbi:orotidine 5'-phosphate decarboxylase / HUMPS family protein [Caldivirga maquilingensis]|uniref:Orotidine 5'-phosphate decarboxylase n=1 Tax=Caldivirga maquilingensis (strain ATCC 700844 / DSM 13496 / JCM 10307 / IC-167) TaxID=397948 RepID=A8MCT3_CALMQ|nr:orotidine 5'-phosphate decarboxylase / HUMPS family protein [Caldivirga maquilingensis]ABW01589.1 orotidine 5'-phosphate decarboxylase [Caldivirga maquilingensis IC-167]
MRIRDLRGISRVVLALDLTEPRRYWDIMNELRGLIKIVKISWVTLLTIGPDGLRRLISDNKDVYFLMDAKLADVGFINNIIAGKFKELGINGIIVHGFIGKVNMPNVSDLDILVLVSMTSGGELYDANFEEVISIIKEINAAGVIIGGNKPNLIRRARSYLGNEYVILSPGIGAQGVKPGCAIANGADFEIVGRAIYESSNPKDSFIKIEDESRKAECG